MLKMNLTFGYNCKMSLKCLLIVSDKNDLNFSYNFGSVCIGAEIYLMDAQIYLISSTKLEMKALNVNCVGNSIFCKGKLNLL